MRENFEHDFNLFRKDKGISGIAMGDYIDFQNKAYDHLDIQNRARVSGHINPSIIEERPMNITQLDVFSRLMIDRIIFLGTGIDDTVSNIVTAQLLFLASQDSEKPIDLYINSVGGSIVAGYSIFDTMDFIKPDVNTLVTGMAASMAFILSINGIKRSALKHSRLMLHQPLATIGHSQATDIGIRYKQIQRFKEETNGIIADKCGQSLEQVKIDAERDFWLTSFEAKEYGEKGAIDTIIGEEGN